MKQQANSEVVAPCLVKTVNMGYIQATDWLEKMSKRYRQEQCNKCSLWHVWRKK